MKTPENFAIESDHRLNLQRGRHFWATGEKSAIIYLKEPKSTIMKPCKPFDCDSATEGPKTLQLDAPIVCFANRFFRSSLAFFRNRNAHDGLMQTMTGS